MIYHKGRPYVKTIAQYRTYLLRVRRAQREKFARERECVRLAVAKRFTTTSRILLPRYRGLRVGVVGNARLVTHGRGEGNGAAGQPRYSGSGVREVRLRPSTPRDPRAQRVAGIVVGGSPPRG
uniref:Uncharacterized protein n=1 Tax=Schizaphis graminum TaxID=13262 RepID=A0A2S2PBH0_SCHGA